MRCPDCTKFVSMENGDPEVNSLEATLNDKFIEITSDIHLARNCADCGTELKALDIQPETNVALDELKGYAELSKEDQQRFQAAAETDNGIEVEIDETSSQVDEAGGGRYKKNLITCTVCADLKVTLHADGDKPEIVLTHPVELSEENPASAYDEQV